MNLVIIYKDFKKVVLNFYLNIEINKRYIVIDLDILVKEYNRLNISNIIELTDFYRKFIIIISYFFTKEYILYIE